MTDKTPERTDLLNSLHPYCRHITQNINFSQLNECIAVGALLAETLLSQNISRMLTLQIKKHVKHFESVSQYLPASNTTETQLKVT